MSDNAAVEAQSLSLSRRRFLLQAMGLSAAGLAIGGGGAWVKGQMDKGAAAEAALADLRAQLGAAADGSATVADVVAALQSQLASALSQNTQLAGALSATQQEIAAMKSQLGTTTDQLARHKELVSLYDQLEAAGLDSVVQSGLSAAAGGLSAALGLGPVVAEGLTAAGSLLDNFEQTLPTLREAMTWLGDQTVSLRLSLYAIETAARRTINAALTGLTSVFGGFASFVLDHLPFNIGGNVRATLDATQALFGGLTAALDGADEKVLGAISPLVSEGPQDLSRTLVTPLREKAFAPAGQMVSALSEANKTFVEALESPARVALSQRADVRARLAAFRQTNGI